MRLVENPPHTVFGTTLLPQVYVLTMRVGGLRELIEDMPDEGTLQIRIPANTAPIEFYKNPTEENG